MKAILYARFSPRPDADECESCDRQLADLREYCGSHGYDVVGEFYDKALSGGDSWTARPGMFDAANACRKGYVFVVRAFDRLFRDTRKALMFACDIERKGVTIISATEEAASLDTPEARLMRTFFLALAEYQRELIRARTAARMRQHQANGRRMSAKEPWGTCRDPEHPKRLIPCEAEIEITREIVALRDKGLTLREIGAELERRGRERRGKPTWPHVIVLRILKRHSEEAAYELSSI